MQPILFALLPLLVTFLTSVIKRVPVIDNVDSQGTRYVIIRAIAALLSFGGVIGTYMLTGTPPDPTSLSDLIVTLSLTFTTLIGSIGVHEVTKQK